MKKGAIALLTFAVAILTASCQKENISEQVAEYTPMTINAVANGIDIPATKTSLALKFDVNWNKNDKIYVTDGSNKNTFTLSSGQGTPKGSFTQDGTPESFTSEVIAYYPYTIVKDEIEWHLEWPADQKNDQTIPMYCETTLSGQGAQRMDFSSLGSVLRIAFTTAVSDITLKSITIKDDEKKMSGEFTVNDKGCAIVNQSSGTNSITLDLGAGVVVSNKINYFHIAIPAGNYQKCTITFTATDGKQCVMTGGKINIGHNTVGTLSLTGKAFNLFGQGEADVKAEAGIQGNKVKWIQLWENGPKFAEYNVGVTDGKAESYGGYYAWGGSQNKVDDHNNGSVVLSGNNDTATKLWGENWRMPTYAELDELINNCNVENVEDPEDNTKILGKKFKGKGAYASNSVFLPAAGLYNNGAYNQGDYGLYWSSTPDGSSNAYYLLFNSGDQNVYSSYRFYGYSVRAVLAE